MVAAAEAGGAGDRQDRPVKQALQIEEEELNQLREAFAVFDDDGACYDVRNDTKYSLRTGNKLSPLVMCNSAQFGTEEMIKNASGPWKSPRTDPPTEVKY